MRLGRHALLQVALRLVLGGSVAFVAACASGPRGPSASVERSHRVLHPKVVVTAPLDALPEDVSWVEELLPEALSRLAAFDLALRSRVELRLHASRASFERDIGRRSSWLQAWAGYDLIHFSPPSTWRDSSRAVRLERLTHELAHAAMFQALGDEQAARRVRPPFWFQEGVASFVAQQEARRMPLTLVVERAADADPLTSAESFLARDHYVAYAAAHHAMAWLVERQGRGVIAAVLRRARADGDAGAIDRAVEEVAELRRAELWPRVRSSSERLEAHREAGASAPELTR